MSRKIVFCEIKMNRAYQAGVAAYRNNLPDINPWGKIRLMEMCAWSAGYFDCKRGMV